MSKEYQSAEKTPPTKPGWYKIVTKTGDEFVAPFSRTMSGVFTWVLPDTSVVVKWKDSEPDMNIPKHIRDNS